MSRIKDMTQGHPAKLIFTFALPLMLGNIFQQFYAMVDTIVVGRGVGVEALAALGAADWLNWMVLGTITGLTQGFSIMISQRFGAEDLQGLKKSITMSVILSAAIAILISILSQIIAFPLLKFLNTPSNVIESSLTYLRITFSGIIIITAYNIFASILRALGDSKTPLIAMIIAAIINVILDILFVMGFHWGVGGAAAATVIAQLFSALFCVAAILRIPILAFEKEDWKINRNYIFKLIKLGTPMAFQNGIIAVGGLGLQYVVNGFGFIFVAGFTATNKLYGLLELAATSFGFSMATFTGQNLGAKKYNRIKSGMRYAIVMAIGISLIIAIVMIIFGREFAMLFISGPQEQAAEVIAVAYDYLFVMSVMLPVLYMLHLYRSALQGMGDTVLPMVSGIIELAMRLSIAFILPIFIGAFGIYIAEVSAWAGAAILLIIVYYYRMYKLFHPKELSQQISNHAEMISD